jgi:hypothetical protein
MSSPSVIVLGPDIVMLHGKTFVLEVMVLFALMVIVEVPAKVIVGDSVILPETVRVLFRVKVPVYSNSSRTELKIRLRHVLEAVDTVQFPLFPVKYAASAAVGTAPSAGPPSLSDQLLAVFQSVPAFLK